MWLCILLAHSFIALLVSRLLLGIGVGIVSVAVPLYVTELALKEDRGKYVTFFQLFLTFGIVLAYFVDLAFTPSGSWRAMFAMVLIPAIILLIGVMRLPESPRWLIAKGEVDKARQVLGRTRSKDRTETALIFIHESLKESKGTWGELLSLKLILPLFIGVAIAILNQWTGINVFFAVRAGYFEKCGLRLKFCIYVGVCWSWYN